MTFDPKQFLDFANKLLNDQSYSDDLNEARYRTVINRAYYSTFLILREYLSEILGQLISGVSSEYNRIIKSGAGAHTLMKNIIALIDSRWSQLFGNLLALRKEADYCLLPKRKPNAKLAQDAIIFAEKILSKKCYLENILKDATLERKITEKIYEHSML